MSKEENNDMPEFNFDLPKYKSSVIKVVGVGGGGSNAVNYMYSQGITGVDFMVTNTDAQALMSSPIPNKIQLGVKITEGLGAGANPEVGEQSAMESIDEIKDVFGEQTKMVFITAGMGGGTGTGAAPIIAKVAKELDILTVGIVTAPFQFEGRKRIEQANEGIEEMKKHCDSLIIINNNKLREVYGNFGAKAGFAKADEVLATAAKGIAEVITKNFTVNIDLKDARTVLANSGTAIMGSATASGENRAKEVIMKALDSPLLNNNKIYGAKNVLLLILSGPDENEITLDEIAEVNEYIQDQAGNNVEIIMGLGEEPELGDEISVTVIATGFDSKKEESIDMINEKKIIHTLEDDQEVSHEFNLNAQKPTKAKLDLEEIFANISDNDDTEQPIKKQESEVDEVDILQTRFNFELDDQKPLHEKPASLSSDQKPIIEHTLEEDENEVQNDLEDDMHFTLESGTSEQEDLDELKIEIEFDEQHKEDTEDTSEEDIDPFDLPISESLQRANKNRMAHLKKYNHGFSDRSSINELEKTPAFERSGMEIDEKKFEYKKSDTSLEKDEDNNLFLRKNNSYLHDNVD